MISWIIFAGLAVLIVGSTVLSYRKEPEVMWNRLQRMAVGLLAMAPILVASFLIPTVYVMVTSLIGLYVVATKLSGWAADKFVPRIDSQEEKSKE